MLSALGRAASRRIALGRHSSCPRPTRAPKVRFQALPRAALPMRLRRRRDTVAHMRAIKQIRLSALNLLQCRNALAKRPLHQIQVGSLSCHSFDDQEARTRQRQRVRVGAAAIKDQTGQKQNHQGPACNPRKIDNLQERSPLRAARRQSIQSQKPHSRKIDPKHNELGEVIGSRAFPGDCTCYVMLD